MPKGSYGQQPRAFVYRHFAACRVGCDIKYGETCPTGIHKHIPSKTEKEHPSFKQPEEKYGEWTLGKFKYDRTGAPSRKGGGKANAVETPVGSPRAAATDGDATP